MKKEFICVLVLFQVESQYQLTTNETGVTTFKVGGDFYSYLDKKSEKYSIPIRVELIHLNNYYCPHGINIPYNTFNLQDVVYGLEMEEIKIYNIYLLNII